MTWIANGRMNVCQAMTVYTASKQLRKLGKLQGVLPRPCHPCKGSSYAEGVKPEQRRSLDCKGEWALPFQDHSRVMIGYLKPMVPAMQGVVVRLMFMPSLSLGCPDCPPDLFYTLACAPFWLPQFAVASSAGPPRRTTPGLSD